MALTKKSLNNFLPNGFETQNKEGYKANFTNDRILSGYEKDTLEILSGPNLNNFIDKTGKNFNTLNDLLEYFNAMPIDSFPIVNASNQLDYKSINSFFRNVGELVFSSVPIDDKNLHLADGSLLDGKGTYRVFVDFIGKMATKYPNLFTDEATWQATVSKYGTCGKYVWNAENKTLRLPRLKGIVEATIDQNSIGNITEAGLPNITGTAQFSQEWETWGKYGYTGAFYLQKRGGNGVDGDRGNFDIVGFDASRSSKVYGKSNTVQPQTVKQYIYIVVSVDTEETTKLTSVFQYRGSVPTFEDLPTEGNITGDVWNVDETDVNYVWDGNEWDQLSGSVDLTGYYTKEQADTRFATVTSLESNVENLQAKITQNTIDIASLGLGDMVASSLEKGKALKYLETKGNITEDADVYNDVYNYKHSSFDLSKFTVVGTPNITEYGVASGFSSGNYINTGFILSDLYNKKWTIKSRTVYNYMDDVGNLGVTLHSIYNGRQWLSKGQFGIANRTGSIYFYAQTIDGTEGNKISILVTDTNIKDGDIVDLELSFDLTTYTLKAIINNSQTIIKSWTPTTEDKNLLGTQTTDPIYINSRQGGGTITNSNCSIDLKQFSIIVDGKEVFNGNKTGLDIVKPDNYEVSGNNLNISEDGFLTVSAANNGVIIKSLDLSKPFVLEFSENYNGKNSSGIHSNNLNVQPQVYNNTCYFILNPLNTGAINGRVNYSNNNKIYYRVSWDGYTYRLQYRGDKSPIEWTNVVSFASETPLASSVVFLLGYNKNSQYFTSAGIDLNDFKFYSNGQLVYQPCLKIPYNISKTGLKVVNADARERVIGMGEDYGYSQYFTIDEENKNATLPIGAGITGRQDLIASFDDGTNKYEQFSDLTFKQSGTCTANTAVTFIQPYKDDTYKLSVPYSAKTKTGFTPTVSGDWFAEGKIYLD